MADFVGKRSAGQVGPTSSPSTSKGSTPGKQTRVEQAYGTPAQPAATAASPPAAGAPAAAAPGARRTVSGRDMFDIASGIARPVGAIPGVEAMTDGDKVVAQTPGIAMEATVTLKPDVDPDPASVDVGWVQTITSSQRIGVYQNNGVVERKDIAAFSGARDVMPGPPPPLPWYTAPEPITSSKRAAHPHAEDQPKLEVPATLAGAKLTEIQGADHFNTSLAFGSGGAVENIQSFAWTAPWNVTIDQGSGTGKGSSVSVAPATPAAPPANDRPASDISKDPENHVQSYETEDAAVAALGSTNISLFIADLPKHKALAPSSYWNMVGALWKSSAVVRVKLTPSGGSELPDVTVACSADNSVNAVKQGSEFVALAHMVYDPAQLGPGHAIQISIDGNNQLTLDFPYKTKTVPAQLSKPSSIPFVGPTQYQYNLEAGLG